jgi:hypothetical protein
MEMAMALNKIELSVTTGNISHFEELLKSETDEQKRRTFKEILAREKARRAVLLADK